MATLLGPLTATFTPPSDCNWFSVHVYEAQPLTYIQKYALEYPSSQRCFPPGWPSTANALTEYYYSPGLCPSGWTSYHKSLQPQEEDEITVSCCAPGYSGQADPGDGCFMTINAPTTVTAVVLTGIATNPLTTSTDYVISTALLYMNALFMRYRSADFPELFQPSQSSGNPSLPTGIADAGGGPTGLSSGAKIGIGVGIPFAVFVLAIVLFIVYRRRRISNVNTITGTDDDAFHDAIFSKPELPGNAHGEPYGEDYSGKPELDTISTQINPTAELGEIEHLNTRSKMQDQDRPSVPNNKLTTPYELEGDTEGPRSAVPATNPGLQKADISASPHATSPATAKHPATPSSSNAAQFTIATGPLPSVTELFPSMTGPDEDSLDEEELRYQEQRLKERRELLAEKEKLALEEDRLRRIRAKKTGENSRSGRN